MLINVLHKVNIYYLLFKQEEASFYQRKHQMMLLADVYSSNSGAAFPIDLQKYIS